MTASPFKNVGFAIVKDSSGKLSWQPIAQPFDGCVTLLYGEQNLHGCYFNDGSYTYPLSTADGEKGRLIDLLTAAHDSLYAPIVETIRQEFLKIWGTNTRIHSVVGNTQFLELVMLGSSQGLGLPSSFMGLDIRCSPLHQPSMNG